MITYHYDPVCKRRVKKQKAYYVHHHKDETVLLCCPECQAQFESDISGYIEKAQRLEGKTNRARA